MFSTIVCLRALLRRVGNSSALALDPGPIFTIRISHIPHAALRRQVVVVCPLLSPIANLLHAARKCLKECLPLLTRFKLRFWGQIALTKNRNSEQSWKKQTDKKPQMLIFFLPGGFPKEIPYFGSFYFPSLRSKMDLSQNHVAILSSTGRGGGIVSTSKWIWNDDLGANRKDQKAFGPSLQKECLLLGKCGNNTLVMWKRGCFSG